MSKAGKAAAMLGIVSPLLPVWECGNAFADPPFWAPANGYRHHREQDEEDGDYALEPEKWFKPLLFLFMGLTVALVTVN